jgi:hypothetical protein
MGDTILQAVQNNDSKKFKSIILGIVVTSIVFFFAVGLFYMFIFYKTNVAFIDGVYLFMCIYVTGAITTMLYYRFIVVGDDKMEIDKMSLGAVSAVFGKCFVAFLGILGFTMIAIALNPSLVQIFENTLGYGVCRSWGVNTLLNQMLRSHIFDEVVRDMPPEDKQQYMNYDFLITTWSINDKEKLRKDIADACADKNSRKRDLQFDFFWVPDTITTQKVDDLMGYIDLKYYVGHFTWVYIGSLFSLLVSLVSVLMN